MAKNKSPRLSFPAALAWIIGSALFFSGSLFSLSKWMRAKKENEKKLYIQGIVQLGAEKYFLPSHFFMEWLDLSSDAPKSISSFSLKEAENKLLKHPVIALASLKLLNQGVLAIEYSLKKPIATLYDYENTALDCEGNLLPLHPYYSPRMLPEVYLGLGPFGEKASFEAPLKGEGLDLSLAILNLLKSEKSFEAFNIKRVDVSNAFENSYGKREVVLILESEGRSSFEYTLRLFPKNYKAQLESFLSLYHSHFKEREKQGIEQNPSIKHTAAKTLIIDLRIDDLAFIQAHG